MPRNRKSDVVDGFNVYKAAQHAAQKKKAPTEKAAPKPAPADTSKKIGSHIGRTVLPSKHDVTCYECGYDFQLTGAVKSTYCSKCRAQIAVENFTIKDEWTEDIKTAGTVIIKPEGDVVSGTIKANHIIVEGRASGGLLKAFRWLELRSSATFDPERMTSAHLLIGPDAHLILPEVRYDEITVHGTLKSRVFAAGLIRIMDGGRVEGEIHGSRLAVEDGGSLRAEVEVRPQDQPTADAEDDVLMGKTA